MLNNTFVGTKKKLMAKKAYNHNGKEIKPSKGKNIRVSDKGWETIRRYCFDNNLKMGAFTESSALEKISAKIKSSKKQ